MKHFHKTLSSARKEIKKLHPSEQEGIVIMKTGFKVSRYWIGTKLDWLTK